MGEHPFWFLLAMACVVWYSTITVYVAIRGTADIKGMLKRLADTAEEEALEASRDATATKGR